MWGPLPLALSCLVRCFLGKYSWDSDYRDTHGVTLSPAWTGEALCTPNPWLQSQKDANTWTQAVLESASIFQWLSAQNFNPCYFYCCSRLGIVFEYWDGVCWAHFVRPLLTVQVQERFRKRLSWRLMSEICFTTVLKGTLLRFNAASLNFVGGRVLIGHCKSFYTN